MLIREKTELKLNCTQFLCSSSVFIRMCCSNSCSSGLFYELCGKPVCQNHSFRQAEICGGNTRQKTLIVPPTIKESETYLSPKHNLKNASSVSQAPAQSLRGTSDTFSQASVAASTRPEATVSVVLEEELSEDSTKSRAPPVATAAVDSPSSTKKPLGIAPGQEEQEDEKPALKLSVSRVESVSIRSDETPTRKADFDLTTQPAEAPTISMFLATANFLLDVGALKVRIPLHVYVCMYCACACVSIKYVDLEMFDCCFGCMELGVLHWDIHTYILTYVYAL